MEFNTKISYTIDLINQLKSNTKYIKDNINTISNSLTTIKTQVSTLENSINGFADTAINPIKTFVY